MGLVSYLVLLYILDYTASTSDLRGGTYESRQVGEGVHVNAYIYYDSKYAEAKKRKTKEEPQAATKENALDEGYFDTLFKEVEEYFHNKSVMVTIKVQNVTKNDSLSVREGTKFDARKALENVVQYGGSLAKSNDSIFYFFTWDSEKFNECSLPPKNGCDLQTNGSFCSGSTSAAVVRHRHGSYTYWASLRATALIFGSDHFFYYSSGDLKKMREHFQNCPLYTEVPEAVPAC